MDLGKQSFRCLVRQQQSIREAHVWSTESPESHIRRLSSFWFGVLAIETVHPGPDDILLPGQLIGPSDFGVGTFVAKLIELADADACDPLDNYVEAHIHGPVSLGTDIDALVLDPVYRNTSVEALARELPCNLEWHDGFSLSVDVIEEHADYRGQKVVAIAKSLANRGQLNPAMIGAAVENQLYDPQDLKKVWHVLARFGNSW